MKIFNKKVNRKKSPSAFGGYAVLELIFYITFFAILSIVLVNAMITMAKSFKETSIQAELVQSGMMMEKISRELRQADDFSFASNILIINTRDDFDNSKTITYAFFDSSAQIEDSLLGDLGNLNTPNIAIIDFNFTPVITAKGKAAVVTLTVRSNNDTSERTITFNNTVVLRGSY